MPEIMMTHLNRVEECTPVESGATFFEQRQNKGRHVPENRMVRVMVQDPSGKRIPEALISIKRAPAPPPNIKAVSNLAGEAEMPILQIGQYEFVCSADHFESATVTAMITDAPLSLVMIILRPDS